MSSFQVLNGKIMGGPVIPVESMKLLWTNPDPSVAFEAQNITLASEDYDFLLWIFRYFTTLDKICCTIVSPKGSGAHASYVASNNFRGRGVAYVSNTEFSVEDATTSVGGGTASVLNTCLIPISVYGFKKSSIGGGDDHLMKYSTNEQIVGTWIDGKPIYQKTITGTTGNNSDPLYLATGISIGKVINIEASVCQAGNTYVFNNFWANAVSSNTVLGFKIAATNNSHSTMPNNLIITASHSNYQGCPFYITIKYTKTTD